MTESVVARLFEGRHHGPISSSAIRPVAFGRPACPRCKAEMMLASIEPARPGVELHTFECAVCDHVLTALAAYEDPMKSKALGRWLQGDLHSPT